jgi:hypothetical protein
MSGKNFNCSQRQIFSSFRFGSVTRSAQPGRQRRLLKFAPVSLSKTLQGIFPMFFHSKKPFQRPAMAFNTGFSPLAGQSPPATTALMRPSLKRRVMSSSTWSGPAL